MKRIVSETNILEYVNRNINRIQNSLNTMISKLFKRVFFKDFIALIIGWVFYLHKIGKIM